ncbi:MAG TPA: hypothetical protein VFQ45_02735, partial [Longimicrobium sp.]|nr:hypothetical protein [Longimicrobium sp.]
MRLRFVLEQTRQGKDDELADILAARDMVIARYQPVFSPEHLPELTADEFKSFLSFTNNRHWSSIGRHATRLTSDMAALRRTLLVLVDESRPVGRRVTDVLARNGAAKIPGLGKAVATPILLLGNPEKYGVWNDPAEKGMRLLGIWPADESMTEGEKYERIVALLQRLCHDLSVDLWTLDALWWRVVSLGIEKIYSVEEFESALRTLEDLDASDPLDVSRQVAARVEQ